MKCDDGYIWDVDSDPVFSTRVTRVTDHPLYFLTVIHCKVFGFPFYEEIVNRVFLSLQLCSGNLFIF